MNTQILASVIVSSEQKISILKHPECLTKQIWYSTWVIGLQLMLPKKKKPKRFTFILANPEKIQEN